MKNKEFSSRIRVYIEDTDAGGIVYYANYLKFAERARTEWLRQLGFEQSQLQQDNRLFVVKSLSFDYLASAKLDDCLLVTVEPIKISKASLLIEQNVYLLHKNNDVLSITNDNLANLATGEKKRLASGQIKIACIDAQSGKVSAMPEDLYKKLSLS